MGINLSSFDSAQAVVETKIPLIKYQIVTNHAIPSTSRRPVLQVTFIM